MENQGKPSTSKPGLTLEQVKDNIRRNRLNSSSNSQTELKSSPKEDSPHDAPPPVHEESDHPSGVNDKMDSMAENNKEINKTELNKPPVGDDNINTDRDSPDQDNRTSPKLLQEVVTHHSPPHLHKLHSNITESDSKTNTDDYELSLDHIKSMVAKLDDESDDEANHHNETPASTYNQVMDPSIVYAKKAEPGKTIDGLQDWIYRDPQGEIQGMHK